MEEEYMRSKKITLGLLIVYLMALTWIILFKLQFSVADLPHLRSINLVPFMGSVIVNGKVDFTEIINNIVAFIPFGILLSTLWEEKSIIKRILPIFLTSLSFEILQFIFSIGASDITDLIMNTIGGIIGICIFIILKKILKDKCSKVVNIISLIFAIVLILFIALLILANS